MALLIDIAAVPACACDDALERIFKAIAVQPPGAAAGDIWRPVENPWLTFHTEDVTSRLLALAARGLPWQSLEVIDLKRASAGPKTPSQKKMMGVSKGRRIPSSPFGPQTKDQPYRIPP